MSSFTFKRTQEEKSQKKLRSIRSNIYLDFHKRTAEIFMKWLVYTLHSILRKFSLLFFKLLQFFPCFHIFASHFMKFCLTFEKSRAAAHRKY